MSSRAPFPFVVSWRVALRESQELSTTQYAIAQTIATYMRPDGWTGPDPRFSPGRKAIARGSKIELRTVDKDANLWSITDTGLLFIVGRPRTTHVYVAGIPRLLAQQLVDTGKLKAIDFQACAYIDGSHVGPGANEVLQAGRTSFTPLVNVVPQGGEPRSPELAPQQQRSLLEGMRRSAAAEPDDVAELVRRSLREATG